MWGTQVFPGFGQVQLRFPLIPGDENDENEAMGDMPSDYVITVGTTLSEVLPPIITWARATDPSQEGGRFFEGFHRESRNDPWEVIWT